MKLSVAKNQSELGTDLIEFTSIRDPEITFTRSYETLTAMGIRHDIAQSLASYTTFRGEEFDPTSPVLVNLHEEIGQEPFVKGGTAA